MYYDEYEEYVDEYAKEQMDFEDTRGRSALRRVTTRNPRNQPCPTCGRSNMLTPKDVAKGYQCDYCADADEGSNWLGEY